MKTRKKKKNQSSYRELVVEILLSDPLSHILRS